MAQGQGIELDVQASRDGHAVVFHDYDLERLTTASGKVAHRTLAELRQVRLRGTVETIPDLPEILALIGGRASLLIEVKAPRSEEHTSELQSLMRISYAVFCLKKKTKESKKE